MASFSNMKALWFIRIVSRDKLSIKDKDFIVDLIDAECHNTTGNRCFIVHDILEENNILEAIIEGTRAAANNIKRVLIANFRKK